MIYYVDSVNGNDNNSGLSPKNPKKTLSAFEYTSSRSQPLLRNGDKVLLKRGTKYYGFRKFWVGGTGEDFGRPVIVGAYGAGENPILSCAKEIVNNVWTSLGNNIYSVSLTNANNFNGYKGTDATNGDCNVGFLFDDINKKLYGNKKFSMSDLKEQFDFYVDTNGTLFVYSNENPYNVTKHLNVAVMDRTAGALLSLTNNFIYENLTFTECSGHGIQSVSGDGYYNCIIRNCKFINLGGGTWQGTTRLGNGVEFYRYGKNCDIHNCYFENIYDTATTIQGINTEVSNISFRNNIIKKCSQAFEIWVSKDENATPDLGLKNVSFINNLCMQQGYGFGFRDNTNMVDLLLPELVAGASSDLLIKDNIFFNPYYAFYKTLNLSGLNYKFENNKFFCEESKIINTAYPHTALQLDGYKATTEQEKNSVITTYKKEFADSCYEDIIFMENFQYEQSQFMNRLVTNISEYNMDFPIEYKDSSGFLTAAAGVGEITNKVLQRIGKVLFINFKLKASKDIPAWSTFASCNNAEYISVLGGQQTIIGSNSKGIQAFGGGTTFYMQSSNPISNGETVYVSGFIICNNIDY